MSDEAIEVKNAAGNVVLTVGTDVRMVDGPSMAWNAAGAEYESFKVSYVGLTQEECEDVGYAKVFGEFSAKMISIINDEDFWCIEWRRRPVLEYSEYHDQEAQIVDKVTGQTRQGIELKQQVSIYCRLLVHKQSARPPKSTVFA